MAVDWNWPIEFTDGTPAWVEEGDAGKNERLVSATERPFGVAMALSNRRTHTKLCSGSEDYLRNVDLPEIRFLDGSRPSRGSFVSSTLLKLWTADGAEAHIYAWPSMKPATPRVPPITTLNRAALEREEKAQAEAAEMESNDIFGMF